MSENKLDKVYCGLIQYCHGAEHRYIYSEDKLEEILKNKDLLDDNENLYDISGSEILFPIGGSNSSATWFQKIETLEDADRFLSRECETEYDDPTLIDIAEYYMSVETKDTNYGDKRVDTDYILTLLGKTFRDYDVNKYPGLKEVEKQIEILKQSGYENFDYERPF